MKVWTIVAVCYGTYFLAMNSYFGWNWTAKSDAEMISDGICMVLAALVLVTYAIEAN